MHIVFGYNYFRLRKVTPEQIGLFGDDFNDVHFERVQRYFHFFWIPFFPIGKQWILVNKKREKFECTASAEMLLEQLDLGKIRTALFAWSGLLLLIFGFLGYVLYEKIEQISYKHQQEKKLQQHITDLNNNIDSAVNGMYFLFSEKTPKSEYYNYKNNPTKVLKVEGNNILLGCWPQKDDSDFFKVNDEYDLAKLVYTYPMQDSFWIDKSLLKNAINKRPGEFGIEKEFKGISLYKFAKENSYMLKDVIKYAPPLPSIYDGNETNTEWYVEIINKGFDAQVDSVVGFDRNAQWQISKQHSFKYGEVFAVKTNVKSEAYLYFSVKNLQFIYIIKYSNTFASWTLIDKNSTSY